MSTEMHVASYEQHATSGCGAVTSATPVQFKYLSSWSMDFQRYWDKNLSHRFWGFAL